MFKLRLFVILTLIFGVPAMAQNKADLISKSNSGDFYAQCALADMYLYGSGTDVNVDSAIFWYNRAVGKYYVASQQLMLLGIRTGDADDDRGVYLTWFNPRNIVYGPDFEIQLQGNEYVYKNQKIVATVNSGPEIQLFMDDMKFFSKRVGLREGINVIRIYRDGKLCIERPVIYSDAQVAVARTIGAENSSLVSKEEKTEARSGKLAILIGNSTYKDFPLRNPQNDASDMAAALKSIGFDVILANNLNLKDMDKHIEMFSAKAAHYETALFFYAGHGIQMGGENYLIPVDAEFGNETEVKYRSINANFVLDRLVESGVPVKIVILDACRNNPFARSLGRGLASMNSPSGTFLAFATGPGDVALDGRGRNSPYTAALLECLPEPGISIYETFQNVADKVYASTKGHQNPWISASLRGMIYFAKP